MKTWQLDVIRQGGKVTNIYVSGPSCNVQSGVPSDIQDMRLIAAAPDLLAALQALFDDTHTAAQASAMGRAAIAKATG